MRSRSGRWPLVGELIVPVIEESFAMGGLPDACTDAAPSKLLAAIELSIDARQRLLPRCIGVQVPCQLHSVVQHPTDHDQGRFRAVDKKVARSADDLHTGFDVVPAQSQVPRSNTCAEFGPRETAGSGGLAGWLATSRSAATSRLFARWNHAPGSRLNRRRTSVPRPAALVMTKRSRNFRHAAFSRLCGGRFQSSHASAACHPHSFTDPVIPDT